MLVILGERVSHAPPYPLPCPPKAHEENCWRTATRSFLLVYHSPSENVGDVRAEFIRQMVLAAAAQVPDTDWQRAYEQHDE